MSRNEGDTDQRKKRKAVWLPSTSLKRNSKLLSRIACVWGARKWGEKRKARSCGNTGQAREKSAGHKAGKKEKNKQKNSL